MPFITEELWHAMGDRPYDLIVAKWPMADARALDPEASKEIDWLIGLISEIRATRTALEIPPKALLFLQFGGGAMPETIAQLARNATAVRRLTGVQYEVGWTGEAPAGEYLPLIVDTVEYHLHLQGSVDIPALRARALSKKGTAEKEKITLEKRLLNPAFASNAKPEAVEKAKDDYQKHRSDAFWWQNILDRLG